MASNPSFPLTFAQARDERVRMVASPKALARPVLVLAGWRAFPSMPMKLAGSLATLTGAEASMFIPVAYPAAGSIDAAAGVVVEHAGRAITGGAVEAQELDIVAVSMGGLVARYLASGLWQGQRLKLKKVMTLSTPHRGARLARVFKVDEAARAMEPGSAFLRALDQELPSRGYELRCYTRLRDWWVGAPNCAPPGMEPMWLPTPVLTLGHLFVSLDARLIVEVARVLRGEEPMGRPGATPPTL